MDCRRVYNTFGTGGDLRLEIGGLVESSSSTSNLISSFLLPLHVIGHSSFPLQQMGALCSRESKKRGSDLGCQVYHTGKQGDLLENIACWKSSVYQRHTLSVQNFTKILKLIRSKSHASHTLICLLLKKNRKKMTFEEDIEKFELLCIAGGNIKWFRCCGKWYSGSLDN